MSTRKLIADHGNALFPVVPFPLLAFNPGTDEMTT